ncbi:hypothetical protein L0Z72_14320 [candidate division KSB1 bacterium]|nr:hypothetical protein [candidate division KSB1 bacterium]
MRMNAPKVLTWLISVILGVGGILLKLDVINIVALDKFDFWLVAGGFVLLALGNIFKGL